jgi:hypothetical protein
VLPQCLNVLYYGLSQNFSYFAVPGVFSYTEKFDKVLLDNAVVRVSDLPVAEVLIFALWNQVLQFDLLI